MQGAIVAARICCSFGGYFFSEQGEGIQYGNRQRFGYAGGYGGYRSPYRRRRVPTVYDD